MESKINISQLSSFDKRNLLRVLLADFNERNACYNYNERNTVAECLEVLQPASEEAEQYNAEHPDHGQKPTDQSEEVNFYKRECQRQESLKNSCLATMEDQRKANADLRNRLSDAGIRESQLLMELKEKDESLTLKAIELNSVSCVI